MGTEVVAGGNCGDSAAVVVDSADPVVDTAAAKEKWEEDSADQWVPSEIHLSLTQSNNAAIVCHPAPLAQEVHLK